MLALMTIQVEENEYVPFFIIAPLIEIRQSGSYLPYRAYEFDTHCKGGWEYKIIQATQISRPLCAVPVLKNKITYNMNPHNEKV